VSEAGDATVTIDLTFERSCASQAPKARGTLIFSKPVKGPSGRLSLNLSGIESTKDGGVKRTLLQQLEMMIMIIWWSGFAAGAFTVLVLVIGTLAFLYLSGRREDKSLTTQSPERWDDLAGRHPPAS
jgi:hypothetical protein